MMGRSRSIFVIKMLIMASLGEQLCACPADTARRAQLCFTDLAKGVAGSSDIDDTIRDTLDDHAGGDGDAGDGDGEAAGMEHGTGPSVSRSMPLDYRKIREYCAEDGHMNRFVQCVEGLLQECPDLTQEGALRQLINPHRVRTSVPNLCNDVDKVEANSECMNREMNRRTACKERAYDMMKTGIVQTASNISAMFYVQCRFFSVLAECQRKAVSDTCGGNLGDLHADFLLSFVPNTCSEDTSHDLHQDQGQMEDIYKGETGDQGQSAPGNAKPPEDLMQSKEQNSNLVTGKVKMPQMDKQKSPTLTRSASPSQEDGGFQQVLRTLPPTAEQEVTPDTDHVTNKLPSSQSKVVIGSSVASAPSVGMSLQSLTFTSAMLIQAFVLD